MLMKPISETNREITQSKRHLLSATPSDTVMFYSPSCTADFARLHTESEEKTTLNFFKHRAQRTTF